MDDQAGSETLIGRNRALLRLRAGFRRYGENDPGGL
jgi:hypothetical protein